MNTTSAIETKDSSKDEDYKAKYKKLLHKAKELQTRYEKSVELAQRFDTRNQSLIEKVHKLELDLKNLQEHSDSMQKDYELRLTRVEESKERDSKENQNLTSQLESLTSERDKLSVQVDQLSTQVNNFDSRIASEAEERRIQERKFSQIVKELKRQLAMEKCRNDGVLNEEQTALVERVAQLQHEVWTLEEKLSYLEQTNSTLSEDLANKSDIIKRFFIEQATKTIANSPSSPGGNSMFRRGSLTSNINHIISEKPGLKKVVDFLKERSQPSPVVEGDTITREASKKMQVMLEETLIKCLKLQENLDYVTSELNKLQS